MAKKDFTLTSKILMSLLLAGDMFLVTPHEMKKRLLRGNPFGDRRAITKTAYYLAKKGLIKYIDRDNERFIKLTKTGELEALLAKARVAEPTPKWDGKWRLIIFDIPEESNHKRYLFRTLLKKNNFFRLQQSVYISPHPLNREAIIYLEKSGLIDFIRIMKVEEMDNDKDLIKKFQLNGH